MFSLPQSQIMHNWGADNSDVPLVSICCLAYNHEPYIAQALDGFLMQKTSFPFEVIVHDDASTDKTAEIIREYDAKFPKIIKPIYETENQYSKRNGSLGRIMNEACKGKYIALCEGDDYWIDSLKLQKQVDFLETNSDYSMCCSSCDTVLNGHSLGVPFSDIVTHDREVSLAEIIYHGGLFVPTASKLYRKGIIGKDYPSFCRKCWVGDYPFQIWCAIKGRVYYFHTPMVVYRYLSANSWSERTARLSFFEKRAGIESELRMLNGINSITKYKLNTVILRRKMNFLGRDVHKCRSLVLEGRWYNIFIFYFVIYYKKFYEVAKDVMKRIAPYFYLYHRKFIASRLKLN